jgi:thioredoxin 1
MNDVYATTEPTRAQVESLEGPVVIEFGTSWCGHCRAAQPHIALALADHPRVRHLKIADASGRRLGRSFGIKLWPTLIFLRDGKEVTRLIRPTRPDAIRDALAQIDGA